jgi:hypothetical protein
MPHGAKAVLCCQRSTGWVSAEVTTWRDVAEAMEALRELATPRCGPHCEGSHLVVYGGESVHVWREPATPPPLDVELARLYPRLVVGRTPPEQWPVPASLNEPLQPSPPPNATGPKMRNGERLALAQATAYVPL